ncbi:hypothetical protein BU16DRAFT_560155 [Lophium mytilinum]|uniref:Uncharacterized protein n=1 Tax=Lophium mytilinum TaxID=390894 RepID=A0A6A6QX89_9PEZI|nr:hypothetical protein BU16DRAFT_560155 [Lophium mytilinum]
MAHHTTPFQDINDRLAHNPTGAEASPEMAYPQLYSAPNDDDATRYGDPAVGGEDDWEARTLAGWSDPYRRSFASSPGTHSVMTGENFGTLGPAFQETQHRGGPPTTSPHGNAYQQTHMRGSHEAQGSGGAWSSGPTYFGVAGLVAGQQMVAPEPHLAQQAANYAAQGEDPFQEADLELVLGSREYWVYWPAAYYVPMPHINLFAAGTLRFYLPASSTEQQARFRPSQPTILNPPAVPQYQPLPQPPISPSAHDSVIDPQLLE